MLAQNGYTSDRSVARNRLIIPSSHRSLSRTCRPPAPFSSLIMLLLFSSSLPDVLRSRPVSCPFVELEFSLRLLCATKRLTSAVHNGASINTSHVVRAPFTRYDSKMRLTSVDTSIASPISFNITTTRINGIKHVNERSVYYYLSKVRIPL